MNRDTYTLPRKRLHPMPFIKPFLCILITGLSSTLFGAGGTVEADRKELSLPLLSKKMVIAHNMTGNFYNATGERVELYDPTGTTAPLGGLWQVARMDALLDKGKPFDENKVAKQEIKAAMALGIDGFQFFFPLHANDGFMTRYSKSVMAHIRAAKRYYPDFKITLCYCSPTQKDEAYKINRWAKYLKMILTEPGADDVWLKTPDGRYIFYTWCGDSIIDELENKHFNIRQHPELLARVAWAYEEIGHQAGIQATTIHHFRFSDDKTFVNEFWKYFGAGWTWTENLEALDTFKKAADLAKKKKRTFSITCYPDYYTSKVYPKGGGQMFYGNQIDEMVAQGVDHLERHAQQTDLSRVYRSLLDFAIENDVPLISYCTWNDFGEGHHLAPEINHNFTPGILLNYYKRIWQENPQPVDKDTILLFYKKYAATIEPEPFNIHVHTKKTTGTAHGEEGVEIITLLNTPGTVYYNGGKVGTAGKGMTVFKTPSQLGEITVEVRRSGETAVAVTPPEWITDKPYRTDRITYMYSSRFQEYFDEIYGPDRTPPVSDEYAEDAKGTPNWKNRYGF